METVKATSSWSPNTGVFCLYREPAPAYFTADPLAGAPLAAVLVELDEQEQETGRIAGIEIVGFLEFERWDALPDLPILWDLGIGEPLPWAQLLKREQRKLRAGTTARI